MASLPKGERINTVELSTDGKVAAIGTWSGSVALADAEGALRGSLVTVSRGYITSLSFTPGTCM
jgi:hypothetical protein